MANCKTIKTPSVIVFVNANIIAECCCSLTVFPRGDGTTLGWTARRTWSWHRRPWRPLLGVEHTFPAATWQFLKHDGF